MQCKTYPFTLNQLPWDAVIPQPVPLLSVDECSCKLPVNQHYMSTGSPVPDFI